MKTTIKYILIVIGILLVTAMVNRCHAQETKFSAMAGYKSFELGYSVNHEDSLNFGFAVSAVDSDLIQKRANKNDIYKKVHELNNKFTPAVFGLVGATFDEVTITGKVGASYLDQKINGINEKQKIYFAVGIILSHKLNDRLDLNVSYDNIASAQIGLSLKI